MTERLTTEEFVRKAKLIHGETYSYSKSIYCKSKIAVIVICHVHGEFEQLPNNHLRGHGCKACAVERNKQLLRKNK